MQHIDTLTVLAGRAACHAALALRTAAAFAQIVAAIVITAGVLVVVAKLALFA